MEFGDKLRKGYMHKRIWFSNLPKDQKINIIQTWFYGIFGLCVFSFINASASGLSGIWHFTSIMGGTVVLTFFWANSILCYVFYLEKRIKALETDKNG